MPTPQQQFEFYQGVFFNLVMLQAESLWMTYPRLRGAMTLEQYRREVANGAYDTVVGRFEQIGAESLQANFAEIRDNIIGRVMERLPHQWPDDELDTIAAAIARPHGTQ